MSHTIAFQGEHGAYSELAAIEYFGHDIETIPCKNFKEVFDRVACASADIGLIPIENSLEGSIGQNYDLLAKNRLTIVGETIFRVRHCLIAASGTSLKDVKTVYSHPQALGQCRDFIEMNGMNMIPTYDTAGSVKIIKEKGDADAAAIASELAANMYGMNILARGIESDKNNFTRFFAISRDKNRSKLNNKSTMTFMIQHKPGSLFEVLGEIARHHINIDKLESRAIVGRPWEYSFYIDLEIDAESEMMAMVLDGMSRHADSIKILGSYPKSGNKFVWGTEHGKPNLSTSAKHVLVIGATGGMGRWFCRLFLSEGLEVSAYDRTRSRVEELSKTMGIIVADDIVRSAAKADTIVISVPSRELENVVKTIGSSLRSGQVVIDLTSSKAEPVKLMRRHIKNATVLGAHPLFGPKAETTNQDIILTPEGDAEGKAAAAFGGWLKDMGFSVTVMSPSEHDRVMSVALGLSHFIGLTLGRTWEEFDFNELKGASPTSFKRLLGLVENVAESDPDFYANLQVILPGVLRAEERFIENAQRIAGIVRLKDEKGFADEMRELEKMIKRAQ